MHTARNGHRSIWYILEQSTHANIVWLVIVESSCSFLCMSGQWRVIKVTWCHVESIVYNWPNSQISEYTCSISHNDPFRTEMCTFLFWMGHCGIWNGSILGFVKLVDSSSTCFIWSHWGVVKDAGCHYENIIYNSSQWSTKSAMSQSGEQGVQEKSVDSPLKLNMGSTHQINNLFSKVMCHQTDIIGIPSTDYRELV